MSAYYETNLELVDRRNSTQVDRPGCKGYENFDSIDKDRVNNLFVTSKNETTNSTIYKLKVLHEGQRAF